MEQKRFVKVGLSTDNLKAYVGMIEDEIEEFVAHDPNFKVYQTNDINEWGSFDVITVMQEITILTASRTLQGKEVREGLTKSFAGLYKRSRWRLYSSQLHVPKPTLRKLQEA